MNTIAQAQIDKIVDLYMVNNSVLETAKAAGISTVKARKILITEGLWKSTTSEEIGTLLKQGMTTEEIADDLHMSVKNVQAYMPYERGVYGGEMLSGEAKRAERYRSRMKNAAAMQVVKAGNRDLMQEKKGEENIVENNKIMNLKMSGRKKMDVLRLHLELDMQYTDEEEMEILKKYGAVDQTISRDILVPGDITLHALNYVILRMFGWQNGHLHNFSLPDDVFNQLTNNDFMTWSKMAGVYFRFPTENYQDIYWDDDYKEGESVRTWMRKKYTGPYCYKGNGEHYLINQIKVEEMLARWEEITVHEFDFYAKKQPEPYKVKLREATIDQVMHAFADIVCYELLERVPVSDILYAKNNDKPDFEAVRKYIDSAIHKIDIRNAVNEYQSRRFGSNKQEREYLESCDTFVLPVTEQLVYSYDYGDNWEVIISCEDVYHFEKTGVWKGRNGEADDILTGLLEETVIGHRPVCIRKDGIELVDDVGGIRGFCDMLRTIYEADPDDEEAADERDVMLNWAEMMGWTGRRISPQRTL